MLLIEETNKVLKLKTQVNVERKKFRLSIGHTLCPCSGKPVRRLFRVQIVYRRHMLSVFKFTSKINNPNIEKTTRLR